jgi:protein O-GlcNAc transferase
MTTSLLRDAYSEHQRGNLEQAARLYAEILRADPGNLDALCLLGSLEAQRGAHAEAQKIADRALQSASGAPADSYRLGCLMQNLGRTRDALSCFDKATRIAPNFGDAWQKRGDMLLVGGDAAGALASYDRAVLTKPKDGLLWFNRGSAAIQFGRLEDALGHFDKALSCDPRLTEALYNRANVLLRLRRPEEALGELQRFLARAPNHVDALVSRGVAEAMLGRHDAALSSCDKALALDPNCTNALFNRGDILMMVGRYRDAAASLEKVAALDPGREHAAGNLIHARLMCCDWRVFEEAERLFAASLNARTPPIQPFISIILSRDPAVQRRVAQSWADKECPPAPQMLWRGERYRHAKIRLAYLSADFKFHATAVLMSGLFEHHDKNRFETFAFSYGESEESESRVRLRSAFDRFIDVREKSEAEIASLIREHEIDIAIDLKGYTLGGRNRILSLRPAPVQAHFVGYPGTLGASYVDYLLADKTIIPEKDRVHYTEKIVYLPDTYQPNDSQRADAGPTPTREQVGLPADGFVFCSFNNVYKFTPKVFAVWMRLLTAIEGSVLWLLDDNRDASQALRTAAQEAGISPLRLVFSPRAPHGQHLARQRLADLFVDTFPCNAHTTASDALWIGLPVLTCMGETFAGRVAASLLKAIGLPELVTCSLEDYEALALRLARDPAFLATIRAKLARNRDTHPLFDTARYTRHLETAFATMWERSRRGLPPESFSVPAETP